jgi:hypothetical protein
VPEPLVIPLVIAVVLSAAAVFAGLAAFGARFLLSWYLREIWRVEIRQEAEEAIVTYPLT